MQQPLFIHSDPRFVSRMRSEAGPHALVTDSIEQALRWIKTPGVSLSGIFFSPNGPGQSALQLLEITLVERPVTPVFLIDDENEVAQAHEQHFLENLRIQKLFKGEETFLEFIQPLNVEVHPTLQTIKNRVTSRSEHAGYIAVPLIDFIHSKHYSFDVFLEDEKQGLCLFATAGSPVEPEYLSHVAMKSSWLFVSEASLQEVQKAIQDTSENYQQDAHFPISWKSAETLYRAKLLMKEIQLNGKASDSLVEQTHSILTDIFQIISHLGHETKLQKFINQAKDCDRNIACASLAILMSKVLKFEKTSIVEILGVASFFQDISLYQTPHGNLSGLKKEEMTPEMAEYFLQHSVRSADILAQNTSVPEVTLQVMRQHHERKDRTGFPNRIGGMQLHPMAEILSLINDYLDHSSVHVTLEKDVYSHYSDRMVAAFKTLVPHHENFRERIAA